MTATPLIVRYRGLLLALLGLLVILDALAALFAVALGEWILLASFVMAGAVTVFLYGQVKDYRP